MSSDQQSESHIETTLARSFVRRSGICVTCYIAGSVLVVSIVTLATTWWLATFALAANQEHAERALQQEASEISTFIDREIVSAQNVLRTLASSPHLQQGDFEAFHAQLSQVAKEIGFQFVLRDNRLNAQVINTARPWPSKLVGNITGSPSTAEAETLETGKAAISNLFWGPLIKQHVVAVLIPVRLQNQGSNKGIASHTLSVGIPADRFHQILLNGPPRDDRILSVLDRNGTIVSRSRRNSEFVGEVVKSISPEELSTRAPRGIVRDRNIENVEYCWGYVRSNLTGWTVASGVPESTLRAQAYSTGMDFALAGGGVLLLATVGALGIGARIAKRTGALGIDRPPTLEEFNVLFESSPNGVLLIDGAGLVVLVNAEIDRIFGYPRDMLIGRSIEFLLPERSRSTHISMRRAYAKEAEPRVMAFGAEVCGIRLDGSEVPVEVSLNPISTRSGQLIMATIVDVTKRKLAADELTAIQIERDILRRRFLQAQEDERLRLARDLHDQTGQILVAAMLELKNIEPHIDGNGQGRVHALRNRLESVSKTLHHVAHELRPASIDDLGLVAALANYIDNWSRQYSIPANFHNSGDAEDLPQDLRTVVYRIVQEALNNVAKHALEASVVSIVLDVSDEMVRLTVVDDGSGFVPHEGKASSQEPRLGLAGMRERAALFGGTLEIESSSAGTAVYVRIPTAASSSP